MTDLGAAWDELMAAMPPAWTVARPTWHIEDRRWTLYAWDTSERVKVGKRSREWTAVGATEVDVVREMARCLRDIAADRRPSRGYLMLAATVAADESVKVQVFVFSPPLGAGSRSWTRRP